MRAFGRIVDTDKTDDTEGILLFYIIRNTDKNNPEIFDVTVSIHEAMKGEKDREYYAEGFYKKKKRKKKNLIEVMNGDYVAVYLPKNSNEKYRPLEVAIERDTTDPGSQQQYKYLNISEGRDWEKKTHLKSLVAGIIKRREWSEWSNAPASLELNIQVNSE